MAAPNVGSWVYTMVCDSRRFLTMEPIGAWGSLFRELHQTAENRGTSSGWRLVLGRHRALRRIYSADTCSAVAPPGTSE